MNSLLARGRLVGDDDADPDMAAGADAVPDDISSLDDLLEPDPRPAKRTGRARPGSTKKATAGEKRAIQDSLTMLMGILGGAVSFRDPYCGGALSEQTDDIAAKLVPIIARNPAWVAWFAGSTGFLDVLGLLVALRPVAATVIGHHVTHTIGDDAEGGGGGEPGDLSAFTAPTL